MNEMELKSREIEALESIAKSLSTFAEDTKTNKNLKIELMDHFEHLEQKINEIHENPFGLNERD